MKIPERIWISKQRKIYLADGKSPRKSVQWKSPRGLGFQNNKNRKSPRGLGSRSVCIMLLLRKFSFFEVSAELNAYCIGTGRPSAHKKRAPDIKHSAPGKWHLQFISEELIRTTQINKYHWEFWHLGVHCRIRSCPVTPWRRHCADHQFDYLNTLHTCFARCVIWIPYIHVFPRCVLWVP